MDNELGHAEANLTKTLHANGYPFPLIRKHVQRKRMTVLKMRACLGLFYEDDVSRLVSRKLSYRLLNLKHKIITHELRRQRHLHRG